MATQPNTEQPLTTEVVAGAAEEARMLRDKILFTLEIYPFLSKSMIHQAVGTATSRRLWGPILDRLVEEGAVVTTTISIRTPLERNQTVKLYHLSSRQYLATHDNIATIAHAQGAEALQSSDQD